MTVTAIRTDTRALIMTSECEFDASPERVWQLWADPRQLERWWGPPSHPATVTTHDLRSGGRVGYFLTGPGGEMPGDTWNVITAEPPNLIVFGDGFVSSDGTPNPHPITEMRVTIEPIGSGRTRMSIQTIFPSAAAMEQVLALGMETGLRQALGQIDAILAQDLVRR